MVKVKIGFVVEGNSEKRLIQSDDFRRMAGQFNLEVCDPVIDAKGGGNLCNKNIEPYIKDCRANTGAAHIFVLTDLECEPCIQEVKRRIYGDESEENVVSESIVIVSRKAIEAWFLADSEAMSSWLKMRFTYESPEETPEKPYEVIKGIATANNKPGTGNHKTFARKIINSYGFSLERAAAHPRCPSAAYFLEKLRAVGRSAADEIPVASDTPA